ncbi:DUF2971 domain-containing protein [Pseudomonas sp. DCB_BI]|uniref:DUF2971 domain-containing protein n=1 Tax=Pseudomonas sp. DCB_BI TaxID=2993594 RepID=UPI00224B9F8F|nr:DUF2971 domain-containing protein [Pseudomonas sp. DCB_BI]MCX2889415.1 DUF2971 domain-containing protein [Pseudomonas sp. DCB_BI]
MVLHWAIATIHCLFVCSFSKSANLLSQWRAYGNFAIEFDRRVLEKTFELHDCIYDDEQKILESRYLIDGAHGRLTDLYSSGDRSRINAALEAHFDAVYGLAKFKNKSFDEEKEVRIISGVGEIELKYRAKNDHLIPYVDIEFNVEAIRAIHIGPVANQDLAEKSLWSLLKTRGLSNVDIVKSDIPFRSLR